MRHYYEPEQQLNRPGAGDKTHADESEKIISLGSMEDLIKVADELSKPIIHQARGTPEEPHAYHVFDGATRYQYLLTISKKEQGSNA